MLMQKLPVEAILQPVVAAPRRKRDLLAALLRLASRGLDALAARLQLAQLAQAARPLGEPVLAYHAEAGAPEGALYVNGLLVGRVLGVSRL